MFIEIDGKYNRAKVFTNNVESTAISQITLLCNQEFTEGSQIRMMPDVHAGTGCTIGTTMTIKDKIVPNLVGVDINCGVMVTKFKTDNIDFQELDSFIRKEIPLGCKVRNDPHPYYSEIAYSIERMYSYNQINYGSASRSIGSLGGGNHYIEIDKDDEGYYYLTIHSGSRHLGLEVANYYQKKAYEYHQELAANSKRNSVTDIIAKLKAEGRQKEITEFIQKVKVTSLPKDLCYLEGELFDCYISDTKAIAKFAHLNRQAMTDKIMSFLNCDILDQFETLHNYLDTENMILRKGAVSAQNGEKLIIPMNMKDGALICKGKGNRDWNYSAPHGAGRVMSRGDAKRNLSLSDYKDSMAGIFTTSVAQDTLDESPMVYKPMEEIMTNIVDTVEILKVIKPVYNLKAKE